MFKDFSKIYFDPAWENSAYAHKLDNLFILWILIPFCLSIVYQWNFANSTANNWESNTIYRTYIAYTEGEIIEVIWRSVLCVHQYGFLMSSHIYPRNCNIV